MFSFPLSIYHAKEEVWKFVLDDFRLCLYMISSMLSLDLHIPVQTPKLVHNLQKSENKTFSKKCPTEKEMILFLYQRISGIPEFMTYFYGLS